MLENPVLIEVSFDLKKRQLVESALIANFDNLNIRPGDIPSYIFHATTWDIAVSHLIASCNYSHVGPRPTTE